MGRRYVKSCEPGYRPRTYTVWGTIAWGGILIDFFAQDFCAAIPRLSKQWTGRLLNTKLCFISDKRLLFVIRTFRLGLCIDKRERANGKGAPRTMPHVEIRVLI